MASRHTAQEILTHLEKKTVGVVATHDKVADTVRMRVMYYGADNKFNCYLMSTKGSPKIEQILGIPKVSFLVYGLEDPYDTSWEVEINGEARVLERPDEIKYGLEKLKGRNPFADVALDAGITGQFDMVKLVPKVVKFRYYSEILMGEPPTIIEL